MLLDTNSKSCYLCHNLVTTNTYQTEEGETFCCKGCQVVYHILKAQEALDKFHEHPIYKQALQAGLISNPIFHSSKEEEEKIPEEEFQKLHMSIQNMWCPSCAQVIHLILMKKKGIRKCVVDYATDLALIDYTPRWVSKEKVIEFIRQLGYEPQFLQDPRQKSMSRSLLLRFVVAAFFSLNVMMFAYPIYATYLDGEDDKGYAIFFAWISLLGALPVLSYSAWPIWQRCWIAFKVGIWGMEALVCLGITAATVLSFYQLLQNSPQIYFDSATIIIMFVLLGKIMESKAKFSAKDALINLSMAIPRRGRKRIASGEEKYFPIKEFQPGDFLVVRMGEKIVLDGIVQEGTGACDESLMTGESLPVAKQIGSSVLAGTFLQQGCLIVKVSTSLEQSTLHRIIEMVSQEIDHKSRYVRAIDQIVKWFVPFVLTLAIGTSLYCFLWKIEDGDHTVVQTAIIRAISVLLISCPCAIGIAAPLAESYVLNLLAKLGIIIRNRGCLSFLGQETTLVCDKTGTVTEGRFTPCQGLEKLTYEEQKALKGLVSTSLHPISVALYAALFCPADPFEKTEECVSKGIQGILKGNSYSLGSSLFMHQQGISIPSEETEDHNSILTTVYFAKEGKLLTTLVLGDQIKPGVKNFLSSLFAVKTLLVSGDSSISVARVAEQCHFQRWYAGYHPLQKKELIEQLKREKEIVAMIGDGINDAPALISAHIGIAVASASDISIQVSDILLTSNHFQSLTQMRKIAILGKKIVKQNLFWAFFYNIIGLALAAAGKLTPLFAAFAMVSSSFIVLLNTQRISFFKRK